MRDFVYNLLNNGLPLDWRQKLAAYLDEWAAKGAEFGPQERYDLALYVESRAALEGRLPRDPNALGAATALEIEAERSRRAIHEGLATAPTFPLDPSKPYQVPQYEWWKYPDQKAPIASIEERKGLGAWYDEAVATGQHDPGFFERVAVSIVRSFFPDSEPTRVVTRTDGNVEVTISAGPTSGALLQQALAIGGLGSAVSGGRVTKEVAETVVDTTVQEATGLPVGPSVLKQPETFADAGPTKEPLRIGHQPTSKSLKEIRESAHPKRWRAGEEYVREFYGASPSTPFPVPQGRAIKGSGGRIVDAPVEMPGNRLVAIEVKTYGQIRTVRGVDNAVTVELTDSIRQQVLKDVWLRDNRPGYDPRWIFLDAPPSAELLEFFREHKIVSVVYGKGTN